MSYNTHYAMAYAFPEAQPCGSSASINNYMLHLQLMKLYALEDPNPATTQAEAPCRDCKDIFAGTQQAYKQNLTGEDARKFAEEYAASVKAKRANETVIRPRKNDKPTAVTDTSATPASLSTKTCNGCKEDKPVSSFGSQDLCRSCRRNQEQQKSSWAERYKSER